MGNHQEWSERQIENLKIIGRSGIQANTIRDNRAEQRYQLARQFRENLKLAREILEIIPKKTIFDLPDRFDGKDIIKQVFIRQPIGPENEVIDQNGRVFIETVDGKCKHTIGIISLFERVGLITPTEGKFIPNQSAITYYQNQ